MCDKSRLLHLTENFTQFSKQEAGLVKIIGQRRFPSASVVVSFSDGATQCLSRFPGETCARVFPTVSAAKGKGCILLPRQNERV